MIAAASPAVGRVKNTGSGKVRLKTPDDIQRIREAGSVIADLFRRIERLSLVGLTTWDIDSLIETVIVRKKGRPAFKTVPGYRFASCIACNHEVVHGIPSRKKKIARGDLVKIDVGVALNGFFADACRTFIAGSGSPEAQRLVEAARAALSRGIESARPGGRIGDIGHSIQTYVEGMGYSVVRSFTGHGVGFSLHEPPVVPHYGRKGTGMVLREGMVLAIEPMINAGRHDVRILEDGWTAVTVDGSLSAHFEHTVAVTREGPLILTE